MNTLPFFLYISLKSLSLFSCYLSQAWMVSSALSTLLSTALLLDKLEENMVKSSWF